VPEYKIKSPPVSFGLKRLLDILLAGSALLILAPLICLVAFSVRLKLGRPVIFSQLRPGLDGHPFRLYKFRTMLDAVDAKGEPLPDEVRLQAFGRTLRSTSLDELPSLWNVLRGDMSLVGPRPLLMQYLPLYSPEQARRHKVKPGITGWAQVNGRNAISWDQKFGFDLWYVENRTLLLDVKIIFMTFGRVFRREGINAGDSATYPGFLGDPKRQETSQDGV
jgi:sugar transferase EpsL